MGTPSPLHSLIAGSLSGSLSVLVCHPMDVIRTQIQTDYSALPLRIAIRSILYNSNLEYSYFRFYGGIIPPLCAQGLYKSVIFTSNNFVSKFLNQNKSRSTAQKYINSCISGFIAGSVNSLVVTPVELLRTNQIINKMNIVECTKLLVHQRGIFGLWRGLTACICRDGPGVAFYISTFEFSKSILLRNTNGDNGSYISTRIMAGALSGVAFWIWALPIDTIKSVIEAEYLKDNSKISAHFPRRFNESIMWKTTSKLLSEGGLRRLYRAWPVALGRGIPQPQ